MGNFISTATLIDRRSGTVKQDSFPRHGPDIGVLPPGALIMRPDSFLIPITGAI